MNFVGKDTSVDAIKALTLTNFHAALAKEVRTRKLSATAESFMKKVIGFIKWLWATEVLESLPRNIGSSDIRFKLAPRPVPTSHCPRGPRSAGTLVPAAATVLALNDELRLHATGHRRPAARRSGPEGRHYHSEEVEGPIRGGRTCGAVFFMARDAGFAAGVSQPPPNALPTIASRQAAGYRRVVGDGAVRKQDSISGSVRKLGLAKPIKLLRKTSATLLDGHEVYGRYADYFLGHSPRSIIDRHYRVPSDELFRQALGWLREQYLAATLITPSMCGANGATVEDGLTGVIHARTFGSSSSCQLLMPQWLQKSRNNAEVVPFIEPYAGPRSPGSRPQGFHGANLFNLAARNRHLR